MSAPSPQLPVSPAESPCDEVSREGSKSARSLSGRRISSPIRSRISRGGSWTSRSKMGLTSASSANDEEESAAMDGIVVGHMVTTQSPREMLRETLSESDHLVPRLSRQPTPKSMGSRLMETQALASPPWVGRRSTSLPAPSSCASQRGTSTTSVVSWNLAGSDRATSERASTSQDAAAHSTSGALARGSAATT